MTADISRYRDEFPVLERKAYLISASLGPISRRAQGYLDEYLDAWRTEGAPDPVWEQHVFPRMGSVKRTFAAPAFGPNPAPSSVIEVGTAAGTEDGTVSVADGPRRHA